MIQTPTGSVVSVVTPSGEAVLCGRLSGGLLGKHSPHNLLEPMPNSGCSTSLATEPTPGQAHVPRHYHADWCIGGADGASSVGSTMAESFSLAGVRSAEGLPTSAGSVSPAYVAAALGPEALGTLELPSKGSAMHAWGTCKPCAFVYKAGCENGVACEFCHLCEPGEKKRRKKDRAATRRCMREQARRRTLHA